MRKPFVLILIAITLILMSGCRTASSASEIPPSEKISQKVTITLSPNSAEYDAKNVPNGTVRFFASIENRTGGPITVAHPAVCFPASFQVGQRMNSSDRHGKSEILLTITKADEKTVVLRDGPYFLDPEHIDHFLIRPGESKQFHIGWFFPNARGRWEDDREAESAFMEKGHYKVRLLYRNFFPKAVVYNSSTNKGTFINAWIGEMLSNEVTVEIK